MPKYSFEKIAINSREKKKPLDSDKDHYLGLENLDPGTFDVTRFNNEGTPKGEKLIMKKGDVLFGKRRAYQRKVAIAPFDGIFSAHGMVLRPNEDVISKDFFPFFIRSKEFLDRAIAISVGSLSPTINWKDLAKLEFWLPDISVQERAAQALWALEETKKTYLSLTEKMDILIKSRFVEMFASTPKNQILGEIASISTGSDLTSKDIANVQDKISKYPVFGAHGLRGYSCRFNYSGPHIIVGRVGAQAGNVDFYDGFFYGTEHALTLQVVNQTILPKWLFFELKNDDLFRLSKGIAQPVISSSSLQRLPVRSPTKIKQQEFISFTENIDKLKFNLQEAIEKIEKMSDKILNQALIQQ
jgi:type I restriction enzyme S subunit